MAGRIVWTELEGKTLDTLYLTTQLNEEQIVHEIHRLHGTPDRQFTMDEIRSRMRYLVSRKKLLPGLEQARRVGFWTHLEKSDL